MSHDEYYRLSTLYSSVFSFIYLLLFIIKGYTAKTPEGTLED